MHSKAAPYIKIIILGATGAVGHQLLLLAIRSERIAEIRVIGRTQPTIDHHKLVFIPLKNSMAEHLNHFVGVSKVFICLGTTIKQAKSKEAFKQVDYNLVVDAAIIAKQAGVPYLGMISAMGANPNAPFFYNQVKGKCEQAVTKIGFDFLQIYRPSLLKGPRKTFRLGERVALFFDKILGWIIPNKYRAISTHTVAKAMLHYSFAASAGTEIIDSDQISVLAR